MSLRVVVWGTGNVGRPAIRAVVSHHQLELAGVVVSSPEKLGVDAGELAGIAETGVRAVSDIAPLLESGVDAVVYAATSDTRPAEAFGEMLQCLRAGASVVSPGFYPAQLPVCAPPPVLELVDEACGAGSSSFFVSGVDPGWAMDILPLFLSGVCADIREIRSREIFNYALYDAPDVVRDIIGFGGPMDELPPMLHDAALRSVWEPSVRILGEALGRPVEGVETHVERRALEQTVEVAGMGTFDAGTQGAFRFEVRGICGGAALYVVEHITRIDDACAPDWPYPTKGRGAHGVQIKGSPNLHVELHADDDRESGAAAGGNATAANRLVNAIEAVCSAKPGIVTPLDLPPITGAGQLARA